METDKGLSLISIGPGAVLEAGDEEPAACGGATLWRNIKYIWMLRKIGNPEHDWFAFGDLFI